MKWLICGLSVLSSTLAWGDGQLCSYDTYQWSVRERKAIDRHRVVKPYRELTPEERDVSSGCTVCEEDQVLLRFTGLSPFKVCKLIAPRVREIMNALQQQRSPLKEVIGYRVGMTRGESDADGYRTGFSNHSFGVALDVNPGQNGLYDNCMEFNPDCRLIKGGPWHPAQVLSMTRDSTIVQAFKRNGFLWGGEIAGRQKDFMHFSPTGY